MSAKIKTPEELRAEAARLEQEARESAIKAAAARARENERLKAARLAVIADEIVRAFSADGLTAVAQHGENAASVYIHPAGTDPKALDNEALANAEVSYAWSGYGRSSTPSIKVRPGKFSHSDEVVTYRERSDKTINAAGIAERLADFAGSEARRRAAEAEREARRKANAGLAEALLEEFGIGYGVNPSMFEDGKVEVRVSFRREMSHEDARRLLSALRDFGIKP